MRFAPAAMAPAAYARSGRPRHGGLSCMKTPFLVVIATAACTTATTHQASVSPAAQARADSGRPSYTAADVHFVAGMIGHHAQAIPMAGGGPPHRARPAGRGPCERILGAPKHEIAFARRWVSGP